MHSFLTTFFDFLQQHENTLNILWWTSVGMMGTLYVITNFLPARIIGKILPLHIVFKPKENIDLDFQSVGYAMLHKTWFARISHYTIFFDAFLWFIVFQYWHWSVAVIVMLLIIVQSILIGDRKFLVSFITMGAVVFGISYWLGTALGWHNAYLMAITGLMFGGWVRFLGHTIEPIPPMVLDDTDQFVKLTPKTFNWKIIALVLIGYIAEFSSALPNRLFPVHVNYLYQFLLRLKPEKTMKWTDVEALSEEAFQGGYRKIQALHDYYEKVSGRNPETVNAAGNTNI